MLHTLLRTRFE